MAEIIRPVGDGYADIERLVNAELERKRLSCWKDGKLLEESVNDYAEFCKKIHFMGYNSYKHFLTANNYIKELRAINRKL